MAKPIENLTAPEQATFLAEIGVNAENVLALLEGEEVTFESVTLPRTGGLVKPADTLTLDNAGRLVVNDNDRPGGRLVANDRRFRGVHFVSDISNTFYEKVVTIPLTASECAVNATYQIIGTIRVSMPITPTTVSLGVLTAFGDTILVDDPNTANIYHFLLTDHRSDLYINVTLKNEAGFLSVTPLPIGGFIWGVNYDAAGIGTASTTSIFDPGDEFSPEAQNLYIHLGSYGGGVGLLTIDYDLEIIVTKP